MQCTQQHIIQYNAGMQQRRIVNNNASKTKKENMCNKNPRVPVFHFLLGGSSGRCMVDVKVTHRQLERCTFSASNTHVVYAQNEGDFRRSCERFWTTRKIKRKKEKQEIALLACDSVPRRNALVFVCFFFLFF